MKAKGEGSEMKMKQRVRRFLVMLAWIGTVLVWGRPCWAVTQIVRAGDTGTPIKFLLVDNTTGTVGQTGKTGAAIGVGVACASGVVGNITVTVQVSGGGVTGTFANASGSVAEAGNGVYDYYPASGEVATGNTILAIQVACAGCITQVYSEQILPGALVTVGTGAGQINPDGSGRVPASGVFNGAGLETAPTNWHLTNLDGSGRGLLQPAQPGVTIPAVTALVNPVPGVSGVTFPALVPSLAQIVAGLPSDGSLQTDLTTVLNTAIPGSPTAASTFALIKAGLTNNTPQSGDSFARLGSPSGASIDADIANVPTALLATAIDGALTLKQEQVINTAMQLDATRTWNAATHTATYTWYRRLAGSTGSDPTRPIVTKVTVYDSTNTQVVSQSVTFSNLP